MRIIIIAIQPIKFLTNNSENGDNRKSDPFKPETCPYVDPVFPTLAFAAGVLRITFTKVQHPTFTFYGILPASIFAEILPIFTFIGIHCCFLDRFKCCYFLRIILNTFSRSERLDFCPHSGRWWFLYFWVGWLSLTFMDMHCLKYSQKVFSLYSL